MSAPVGNKFWELRSKHGREKLFKSSHLMWQAACEYFEWCEANPLIEVDYRGKNNMKIELPKMRAFTLQGLTQYLGCNVSYFDQFEKSLVSKEDAASKGFSLVITRIRETIYNQKFTGAAAGFLNPNIIARDLGLTDKKDVFGKLDIQKTLEQMNDEDLQRLAAEILKQQSNG